MRVGLYIVGCGVCFVMGGFADKHYIAFVDYFIGCGIILLYGKNCARTGKYR